MADTPPILALLDIHKSFLSRPVLDGIHVTVHEGDRVGLLGVNGSGKSTLMRIMAGAIEADSGEVRSRRGLKVSYLDQSFTLDESQTVRKWVEGAFAELHELEAERDHVHRELEIHPDSERTPKLLERQAELTHALEARGAYTANARLEAAMNHLDLPPGEREISTLSGGEKRRVALCRVLLEQPDLLLLDEPTNHLDAQTLEWLEEFLSGYPGTVVLVTHDRYFLDRVATRMVEIARGQVNEYAGNYSDYLITKQREAELAARTEANRQTHLRRELDWLSRQPKARTTKSKARVTAIEQTLENGPPPIDRFTDFQLPDAPRLGKTVMEVEHIFKTLGDRELIGGFTFTMVPGDRIGIVGRNGAGKTTLLRLMLGQDEPDRGKVKRGKNVKIVYADQQRAALDPEETVLQTVTGDADWLRVGGERITVRAYLRRFLFDDEKAAMPIKRLSGGERNRVLLAKLLREGGNLIALDEPTNDLDLQTLRALEDALVAFDGSCIVVSHDRYFLNRVATRILWLEGDGQVHEVVGNYEHFRIYRNKLEQKREAERGARDPEPAKATRQKPKTPPKKLTFNERREFEAMEETILEAETRLDEVHALLEDPQTYMDRPKDEVAALVSEKSDLESRLNKLYERWAELSERA
ncbi:energy-dependent translational throttle protein EttA [bacterium]|nr:energy-dependent translational throttle protein EttA [bacterium]